MLNYYKRN